MRKDDWIAKLYYKELIDKSGDNRDSGKDVSSKKKIFRRKNQFECRGWSSNLKKILPL